MCNYIPGVYLSIQYLLPRKRKPLSTGFSGDSLAEVLLKANEWRTAQNAKIVGGYQSACNFKDVPALRGTNDTIRMMFVDYSAERIQLDNINLDYLNGV